MNYSYMVPTAMNLFGAAQGYSAGNDMEDSAKEMEKLAERNKLLGARELQEQARRQAEEDYRLRSAALARAAASGARVEGSVADYLDNMEEEQSRQLRWLRQSGASRLRLQYQSDLRAADSLRTRAQAQKWGSLVSGFTQAFGWLDKGGMFTKDTTVSTTPQQTGIVYDSGAVGYPVY